MDAILKCLRFQTFPAVHGSQHAVDGLLQYPVEQEGFCMDASACTSSFALTITLVYFTMYSGINKPERSLNCRLPAHDQVLISLP